MIAPGSSEAGSYLHLGRVEPGAALVNQNLRGGPDLRKLCAAGDVVRNDDVRNR